MFCDESPSLATALAEYILGLVVFPCSLALSLIVVSFLLPEGTNGDVKSDAAVKLVSSLFAVATVAVGVRVFSTCDSCDLVHCRRPLVRHWSCFSAAYFSYDLLAMLAVHRLRNLKESFFKAKGLIVVHHLALVIAG